MRKIPVGEVIGKSYTFAFGGYFRVLSVIWLPLLLLGLIGYFTLAPAFAWFLDLVQHASQNPQDKALPLAFVERAQQLNLRVWSFDILELLVYAIVAVGIAKEAMGLRKGFRPAYFWFGLEELLTAGGIFMMIVLTIVFMIVAVIAGTIIVIAVGAALGAASHQAGQSAAVMQTIGVSSLVFFLIGCTAIYLAVRFAFFIVPVSVVEREFGVFRSWELSAGNFWRIFAILVVTIVPIIVLLDGIIWSALAATMWPALAQMRGHAPHDPAAFVGVLKTMMATSRQYLPYLIAVLVIPAPVLYGLIFSPAAFAYQALNPAAPAASAPASPLAEASAVT